MADVAVQQPIQFTGTFEQTVDASFRLVIPSALRLPDKEALYSMIPWPMKTPECLLVLPPDRWQQALEKLKTNYSLTNPYGALFQRVFAGSAVRKKLDEIGRLCIGEKLAAMFNISAKATLVGRIDVFEIWEPGTLQRSLGRIQDVPDSEFDKLEL